MEITSARTAAPPKDGKVEVFLNALGRDSEGISPTAPAITEWRIDGNVQNGPDGRPRIESTLPATLTKGTHHVIATGTTAGGRRLQAEADVDVNVKVTEESSVQVRPASR